MASSYHRNIDGQVSTSDATATNAIVFPCENLISMMADIEVIAISTTNNNQKCWKQMVLVKRLNGGVVVNGTLSNLLTPVGDLGAATWTVQLTTNATNFIVQVVGQSLVNINWFVSVEAMCVVAD